ncbi:hypothetical protein ACFYXC_35875 [Streptomyces sp. NPDC002701]|uniref:hypothetical protein n=1 Tax=Streptomyces sp. NPDC002701 TaxID=3364661 RepID=UPI003697644C
MAEDSRDEDAMVERAGVILADILGCDTQALHSDAGLEELGATEETLATVASFLELDLGVDDLYEDIEDWETVDDVLSSVRDQAA